MILILSTIVLDTDPLHHMIFRSYYNQNIKRWKLQSPTQTNFTFLNTGTASPKNRHLPRRKKRPKDAKEKKQKKTWHIPNSM